MSTPAAEPVRIECPTCGRTLALPPGLAEGAPFVCGACSQRLVNDADTRAFRRADLDPFVRRWGATRGALWGTVLGASLWLPLLAVLSIASGRADAVLLGALAVPWVPLLAWLVRIRAGLPPVRYVVRVAVAIGAYLGWVALLVALEPRWGELLAAAGSDVSDAGEIAALAAALVAAGAVGALAHRAWVRRQPAAAPCDAPAGEA